MTAPADLELERLIDYVKRDRGFDFTGYKRATLGRRVRKRMDDLSIATIPAYVDQLQASPEEFAALFDTILINVSSFFREPPVWEYVEREIIPAILAGKEKGDPIRVWSAGCASGEEAYTIAMLLAEALGAAEMLERVKIFATDIDEQALQQARQAVFRPEQIECVPAGLRERWFRPADGSYRLDEELRRSVIFGRNDLLRDAPISKLDLLSCRNTLMYFNAEAQGDVVRRFQLALNDRGYVILGKSETMLGHSSAFAAEEPSLRIFRKLAGAEPLRRLPLRGTGSRPPGLNLATFLGAIEHGPVAQLVLDPAGRLAVASAALRRMFKVHDTDIGRPLQDLELSYRPVDLRSLIAAAATSGESQHLPGTVSWRPDGEDTYELDIEVTPLRDPQGADIGTSITFLDATGRAQLTSELDHARRDADTAYEELQTMVEELETTNEELQSTNEELETTNEELQSTGAEHQAVTDELGARNRDLYHLNGTLNAILHAIGMAVATVDSELRVELWNERARDLWGLGVDDVRGRHLLKLDIGLPVAQLLPALTQSMDGSDDDDEAVTTLIARDRRGREFECTVRCIALRGPDGVDGAIVLMEAARRTRHRVAVREVTALTSPA